jgi:3-hydroxybutyryl-CoA dehydrogenase
MSIHTIAIIGAGPHGRAIALSALRAGYRIVLEDFSVPTLEQAEVSIGKVLDTRQRANLSLESDIEVAIRDADMIIETAADEMETKIELFTIFDKFAKPNAIFATTTSLHSLAEIAEVTSCPGHCVALRLGLPDQPGSLTVVAGRQTDQQTIAICGELVKRLRGDSA